MEWFTSALNSIRLKAETTLACCSVLYKLRLTVAGGHVQFTGKRKLED